MMGRVKAKYMGEVVEGVSGVVEVGGKVEGERWIRRNGEDGVLYRVVAEVLPPVRVVVERREVRKVEGLSVGEG